MGSESYQEIPHPQPKEPSAPLKVERKEPILVQLMSTEEIQKVMARKSSQVAKPQEVTEEISIEKEVKEVGTERLSTEVTEKKEVSSEDEEWWPGKYRGWGKRGHHGDGERPHHGKGHWRRHHGKHGRHHGGPHGGHHGHHGPHGHHGHKKHWAAKKKWWAEKFNRKFDTALQNALPQIAVHVAQILRSNGENMPTK